MDFFFFDAVILALLGYAVFILATKREEQIKRLFGSRRENAYDQYDKEKFNKSTLILCVVLFVNQAVFMIVERNEAMKMYFYVYFILTIISIAVYIFYLKKYAKKKK